MKFLPVEAEFSMRTNEQTDTTKLLVAFSSLAKATKNSRRYGNKTEGRIKTAKEQESLFFYVWRNPISNLDIETIEARN